MNLSVELATVKRVRSVSYIDGTKDFELISIGNYQTIVGKRAFRVNDLAVCISPDCLVPERICNYRAFVSCYDLEELEDGNFYMTKRVILFNRVSEILVLPLAVLRNLGNLRYDKDEHDYFFKPGPEVEEKYDLSFGFFISENVNLTNILEIERIK